MNLADMATFVCTDMGLYDDTSTALCKAFLSKNYAQLWDKYPWKDTSGYGNAQVNAGIAVVDYPAGMDRIITLRAQVGPNISPPTNLPDVPDMPDDPTVVPPIQADSWFLDPVDSTFLIESYPRIYEDRGNVMFYEEIGNRARRLIRLYPIPIRGTSLFFNGKMQCPGLSNDTDEAAIRNIDPTLIAYAYADMLQRQRQYGKADIKRKEALDLETNAWNLEQQQANLPRRTKATTVAGNSLTEMTDAVCQICGQWTPEYRQIIREFLRRNYQSMYDSFLWPESLVAVRVPYSTEQVVCPEYVDKVLAVRGADNLRIFSADASLFLDLDPTIFDRSGEAIGYTTLTPVGVSTLPSATTKLQIASTNPADTSFVMLRGEVLSTGQEVEETVQLNGTTPVTSFWSYDIPLTVSKDITLGFVTVNAVNDGRLLVQLLPYSRESKHQRLWFLPAPGVNHGAFADSSDPEIPSLPDDVPDPDLPSTRYCLVLAKRAIRPLLADQDSPIITGAQQVLIASAATDLYQKLEKSDLATAMQQKADNSLNVLKQKNTEQANQPRRTKITTAAGNTLAEMTDAVCTICGQWTPEYRASIAEFMRRNYQALYDSFLWPESVVGVVVPYTTGNVIVPEFIDKILSVRGNSNNRLSPADIGLIMDIRPESLSEFGDPLTFTMTTPVAVDKLPSATTKLVLASTNASDVSQVMLRGQVLATGGTEVEEGIFLKGTTPVTSFWSYDIPLTIAKDITNGFLTVRSLVDNELILSLAPYRREAKHQRFVLYPLPDPRLLAPGQTYQCLIFGKRSIRPLLVDQDSPIITGAQQVLIAGAAADLFMKLEKPDMATAFQQKAGASTEVLKAKNTDQAASAPRFVPQIEPRAYFYDTYCGKW